VLPSAIVKPATPGDLDAIAEVYAHFVTTSVATFELEPPDRAEWTRRFEAVTEAGLPFLVAEVTDPAGSAAVAGYAYCAPWKPRPAYRGTVEDSVYVAPWAAGRGVGGLLLDELLAGSAAAGVREVLAVIVDSGDPSSVRLHQRRGFVEAGRLMRVGVKFGRTLDTLLLQRSLAPGRNAGPGGPSGTSARP
jgi:L-amino acid N-acyltransferase YncA